MQKDRNAVEPTVVCPMCNSDQLQSRLDVDHFLYGCGDDQVKLTATVRVYVCGSCGYSFTTPEAEDIRHAAVCRHLGLLTPAQIREMRESRGLSRAQFVAITKIGEATLARWERGEVLQNAAYDRYLRLLAVPEIFSRLSDASNALVATESDVTSITRWRQLKVSKVQATARSAFQLRRF